MSAFSPTSSRRNERTHDAHASNNNDIRTRCIFITACLFILALTELTYFQVFTKLYVEVAATAATTTATTATATATATVPSTDERSNDKDNNNMRRRDGGSFDDQQDQQPPTTTPGSLIPECIHQYKTWGTKYRRPIIIFTAARSGSTLFSHFLTAMNVLAGRGDLDLINLYEAYNRFQKESNIDQFASLMERECTNINETSSKEIVAQIQENLHDDPRTWFRALMDTPTTSDDNSYFALKLFANHLPYATAKEYIDTIMDVYNQKQTDDGRHLPPPKFVMLGRRRIIEAHVSDEIAYENKHYSGRKNNESSAIVIEREILEDYMKWIRGWYEEVQDALDSAGLEYETFEYDHDLLDEVKQRKTINKLGRFLGLYGLGITQVQDAILDFNRLGKKQAVVPVERLVKNWEEVVQWGYGGQVDEWPNLF